MGTGRVVSRSARAAVRLAGRGGRRVVRSWRRSLQLRVVAATMLLGLLAVAVLGAFLAQEISERLLDSRRDQA